MTIAIATTALSPGLGFETWLDIQLARVKLIIIYLDDSAARPLFEAYSKTRPIVLFDGSKANQELTPESRLIFRQGENIGHAISYLLERGDIEWLLHVDMDEILYEPPGMNWEEEFATAPCVAFQNYEAIPVAHATQNPFVDCEWFRVKGKTRFIAYGNGKSAVRVRPGVAAHGPHEFRGFEGKSVTAPVTSAVLLHYPCPSFESWKAKFLHYGNFSGFWYDDPNSPIKIKFMLESRDQIQQALRAGEWDGARDFYQRHIPTEAALQEGIKEGKFWRVPAAGETGKTTHETPVLGRE